MRSRSQIHLLNVGDVWMSVENSAFVDMNALLRCRGGGKSSAKKRAKKVRKEWEGARSSIYTGVWLPQALTRLHLTSLAFKLRGSHERITQGMRRECRDVVHGCETFDASVKMENRGRQISKSVWFSWYEKFIINVRTLLTGFWSSLYVRSTKYKCCVFVASDSTLTSKRLCCHTVWSLIPTQCNEWLQCLMSETYCTFLCMLQQLLSDIRNAHNTATLVLRVFDVESRRDDCRIPYEAVNLHWDPYPMMVAASFPCQVYLLLFFFAHRSSPKTASSSTQATMICHHHHHQPLFHVIIDGCLPDFSTP